MDLNERIEDALTDAPVYGITDESISIIRAELDRLRAIEAVARRIDLPTISEPVRTTLRTALDARAETVRHRTGDSATR